MKVIKYLFVAFIVLAASQSAHAAIQWNGSSDNLFSNKNNYESSQSWNFLFSSASAQRTLIYLNEDYSGKFKFGNDSNERYRGLVFRANPAASPWHLCGWYSNAIHSYDNSGGTAGDANSGIIIADADADSAVRFSAISLTTKSNQVGRVNYAYAGHVVMDEYDPDGTTYRGPVAFKTTGDMRLYKGDLYATNAVLTCGGTMYLYDFNATISGGTLTANSIWLGNGSDRTSTLTIEGATVTNSSGAVYVCREDGATGTLYLNEGATLVTRNLYNQKSGTAMVEFNGGTLKAKEAYSNYGGLLGEANSMTVTVCEKGGTIDNGGFDVKVSADIAGAGALTFAGTGTTTLFANQTATSPLVVGEGTVAVDSCVTAFNRSISVASGATLSFVAALSTATPYATASSFTFASGSTLAVPATTAKGKYKLFTLSSGTFAANAADSITISGISVPYTITAEGDTIYLNIAHDYTPVANIVKTSPTLTGDDVIVGAGGIDVESLTIPAGGKLTFDPIKTPIYVWGSSAGALTFGAGAKLALTPNYAGMTLGRVNLIAFKPEYVAGLPENLNDLFDETTIAPGATYTVTLEDVPDSTPYRKYLVLTVGDYDSGAKEIRITSIGDSITQGSGDGKKIDGVDQSGYYAQYRTRIAARLAANGYRPRMLGILNNCNREATNCPQPEEWSWHSGLSADMIMTTNDRGGVRDNLHVYLDAAGNVDVLTLLIGTNDIGSGNKTAEETYTAYTNLVADIARLRPNTKIVGSTILDRNGENTDNHNKVVAFNALLRADYAAGRLPANYTMIDLFEAVPLTTGVEGNFFDDLLHPHWVGCSTIAENFAGAIMSALPFASYEGTIETEATDEPESALGAARIAATGEGVPLAAYTNGMSHIFTIETASANNTLGGAAPYTEIVTPAGLDRPVKKAGYFMELVRKGTSHHRWVWVDFDATGKTLDEIDFPWTGANMDFALNKLHVYSNDGSIHNVAADDDTVTGAIEGTCMNYSGTDKEGRPADVKATYAGWNDTLGSSGGYGCFQVHRFFDEGEHWHGGEVLFAWNAWGTSQTAATDQIGIGTFFYSRNINNGKTNYSTDYTWTSDALNGAADTITAAGYQAIRLEIWAELEGEPRHGYWSGASGDFDDPKNWEDGTVPLAGENLDFSLLSAGATVSVTGAVARTFGTVTMGSQVVTFTGDKMRAASFSDMSKVAVGENATVTLEGDLALSAEGPLVHSVRTGGKFVVTGRFRAQGAVWFKPQDDTAAGDGTIVLGGIVDESAGATICASSETHSQKWAIGPQGITGVAGTKLWTYSNAGVAPEFRPWTNDFTISVGSVVRADAKSFTLNTTGLDGNGHKITLAGGFADNGDPLNVAGTGRVVVDHVTAAIGDKAAYSGAVEVKDSATLAINVGKKLTSGQITVGSDATLEVAESGTVALGGNLTLADGATLEFAFTERITAPVLDLTGKSVTFGDQIKVALSGIHPSLYGTNGTGDGKYFLTQGGLFKGATLAAVEQPDWVKSIGIDDGGDIFVTIMVNGLMLIVK